jgi:hypothetical protein
MSYAPPKFNLTASGMTLSVLEVIVIGEYV